MTMKFDNLKDLLLHSYSSPIPIDVKIGNDYAAIKIFRSGQTHVKMYSPEKEFTVDVSGLDLSEVALEKHISKELSKEMEADSSVVAVLNSKMCTIRKIKNHTVIVFYMKPRFEFLDEKSMHMLIEEETKKLENVKNR